MNSTKLFNKRYEQRVRRTRAKIFGSAKKPRLAVFRSNKFIYAQLIDDEKGVTVASVSSREFSKEELKKTKREQALLVGKRIAEKASSMGVKNAVFDRRGYLYHGRVGALAEGARSGGLKI